MPEDKGNIFVSWSGSRSQAVGKAFLEWLPQIINAGRPWMSSENIRKGSRWAQDIAIELNRAKFGIVCLSRGNIEAPWILFEAGAISKTVEQAFVCPYLLDIKSFDVPPGPLSQFQSSVAEESDTLRLLKTINEALGSPRTEEELTRAFKKWWPDLDEKLKQARTIQDITGPDRQRTPEAMLAEILDLVRTLAQDDGPKFSPNEIPAFLADRIDERIRLFMAPRRVRSLEPSKKESIR